MLNLPKAFSRSLPPFHPAYTNPPVASHCSHIQHNLFPEDVLKIIGRFLPRQDAISFTVTCVKLFNLRIQENGTGILQAHWWKRVPDPTEMINSIIHPTRRRIDHGNMGNTRSSILNELTLEFESDLSVQQLDHLIQRLKELSRLKELTIDCAYLSRETIVKLLCVAVSLPLSDLNLLNLIDPITIQSLDFLILNRRSLNITLVINCNRLPLERVFPLSTLTNISLFLSDLTLLNLSDNISSDFFTKIGSLKKLHSLTVEGDFTALPDEISHLTHLQSLSINAECLLSLPSTIGQLTSLRILTITGNTLTSLPNEIVRLVELSSLTIDAYHVTSLPPMFDGLHKLQNLMINANTFDPFPEEIVQLSRLRNFEILGNDVEFSSSNIYHFDHLQSLTIDALYLENLPIWLSLLNNLEKLTIHSCTCSFPSGIGVPTNLQVLTIFVDFLETLPADIGNLIGLKKLTIAANLKELPAEIGQLTRLQSLTLKNCYLKVIPETIGQLSQLQNLEIYTRVSTVLPIEINQLTNLQNLTLCVISPSEEELVLPCLLDAVGGLSYLKSLTFMVQQCLTPIPDSIGNLTSLQNLNLTVPGLTVLPDSIGQLKNLQSFILIAPDLRSLPDSISCLKRLQNFILHAPDIDDFCTQIQRSHPHLQIVTVGSTLTASPSTSSPPNCLQKLELISLGNNIYDGDYDEDLSGSLFSLATEVFLSRPLPGKPKLVQENIKVGSLLSDRISQLSNNMKFSIIKNLLVNEYICGLQLVGMRSLTYFSAEPKESIQLSLFGHLTSFKVILSHATEIPDDIEKLSNLRELHITAPRSRNLPTTIEKLTNLQTLRILVNSLMQLPVELGELENLRKLYIFAPCITSLPFTLTRLRNLQNLTVIADSLTTLPAVITQIRSLQTLELVVPHLASLPIELFLLENLHTLILDNPLRRLPAEMTQITCLPKLTKLTISGTFTIWPLETGELGCLQSVMNEAIFLIPHPDGPPNCERSLSIPPSLLTLSLISEFSELEDLTITAEEHTDLPRAIDQLRTLQNLTVFAQESPVLASTIGEFSYLKKLTIVGNELTFLPPEIGRLNGLQSLTIRANKLSILPIELGRLNSLKTLSITGNALTELPRAIGQLDCLENLTLSCHSLSIIPDEIGLLKRLQSLTLIGAFITLPAQISRLNHLTDLMIQAPNLISLPVEILRLRRLRNLTIKVNNVTPELLIKIEQLRRQSVTVTTLGYK